MARLFKFGLGLISCAVVFATSFWAYEEIYFMYSDGNTESRKAIEIMQYTANQKHFDVNMLTGPFPHDYSKENREFIWTLDGQVVATIYFVYIPHDYEIRFSGKMSEYGK